MPMDMNRAPYFDDYDPAKKFHRVLYRPSFAVQARELTQQQTILQNQIARFGDHIFKNGSMVRPGQVNYDVSAHYLKLSATYLGFDVDEKIFIGHQIEGLTSGVKADVVLSSGVEGTDPKTLYVRYASGEGDYNLFLDGEVIQRVDNNDYKCQVLGDIATLTNDSSGFCSIAAIEEGIYYINGYFVINDKQAIVASKYSNVPSLKIGLKLYEYLVSSEDDGSLNDNAQGSYNYAAPGAHRYKLDLKLEYAERDDILSNDFIELQSIEGGLVVNEVRSTEYNELERTLARRTYDESGDYTVRPYNIDIKEHLLDPAVPRFAEGKNLLADGGDETKYAIGIEPGLSYVRGFERVNIVTKWITSNKARAVGSVNNSVTNAGIGQYIYIKQVFKVPNFKEYDTINLYKVSSTDGVVPSGTHLIGTAKVRAIQLVDKNATASLSVYKLFLFDIKLNAGRAWSEVLWITSSDDNLTFTANTVVGGTYDALDLAIQEPTKKESIFPLPHPFVKTLKIGGISDTSYTVQRTYPIQAASAFVLSYSAGTNQVFEAFNGSNYILMDIAGTTADNAFVDLTGKVATTTAWASFTITLAAPYSSTGNFRLVVPVIKTIAAEKLKTKQENHIYNIAVPNKVQGNVDLLDKADGIRLVSVIMNPSVTPIDITDRYDFDDGQRPGFYDLARIQLKTNATPPSSDIRVTFDYFSHSSGDYCSVDSYPSLDYPDIPMYVSDDKSYALSDCVDFRPVIDVSGTSFIGAGGSYGELPFPLTNVRSDYEHYLSRIDKLYVDYLGLFNIVEGSPALLPVPPKSPDNSMVLFELYMNPYGFSVADAKVKFIDNKRYTMRDIGKLEKRIGNLEYYTSLSLLEKETAQMQIKDIDGLDRFKNGFIVEPFNTHAIGESTIQDYKCAIDQSNEKMRPTFNSDSVDLVFDSANSTGVVQTGPLVTLEYYSRDFINQSLGSTTVNINPFSVRSFKGKISFNPDSDNWFDTKKNGTLVINDDENIAALQKMASTANLNQVNWNDWQDVWSSSSTKPVSTTTTSASTGGESKWWGGTTAKTTITATTAVAATTTSTTQSRSGTWTTSTVNIQKKDIGDRTVGMNYIPFMRSIPVILKVDMLKPNTKVYPFFDDIKVSDNCTQAIVLKISGYTKFFKTGYKTEETVTTLGGGSAKILFASPTEIHIIDWNGLGFTTGQTVTGTTSTATAVLTSTAVVKSAGEPFITDNQGRISLKFVIPSTSTLKFRTGERMFVLTDQENNTQFNQTIGTGIFKSEGILNTTQGTILTTASLQTTTKPISESRIESNTSLVSTTTLSTQTVAATGAAQPPPPVQPPAPAPIYITVPGPTVYVPAPATPPPPPLPRRRIFSWFNNDSEPNGGDDPLAQTFLIGEEGGCFITRCDVYFKDRDNEGRPVVFQLREVVNGYPGSVVIPYSEVALYPDEINISDDGSVATAFYMTAPVYLQQGREYCFVLLTDSFDYNVWIGEVGQTDFLTKQIISKQPASGVLFKSQNASTWTAEQMQDMKYILYKARFSIETTEGSGITNYGNTILKNGSLSTVELGVNPIETFSSSTVVRLIQESHGFTSGSSVTLSGFVGTFNNIPEAQINGSHVVSDIELDSYTFTVATAANASGRVGGSTGIASKNIQMDLIRPNIAEMVITGGVSEWGVRTTSGQSANGGQIPYVKESAYSMIDILENNYFMNPRMIASSQNETTLMSGNSSLELKNVIFSNNRNISPVLDLNRLSCIVVGNRIDSPSTTTASKTLTVTVGSRVVSVAHTNHKLSTGSTIDVVSTIDIGSITSVELTGSFTITRTSDNAYTFQVSSALTPTNGTGSVSVTWSHTHYKYVPENIKTGNTAAARYVTKKITVEEPAISVRLLLTAVVMDTSSFEIWYRKQGPFDSTLFSDLPWIKLETPDSFVGLSENLQDFKEYEYNKDFFVGETTVPDEFTSISFKIVMKSTDSTRVPIFDNMRVICLGT